MHLLADFSQIWEWNQPGILHKYEFTMEFWIHYGHPFHPELTGVHKIHSQISPVREFNAAITFFSVATTNFLDPGENSKEANLSFPTYCCLLKKSTVKCKGPKPSLHKMLWKKTTAQIHKVITIVLILGWKRNIC